VNRVFAKQGQTALKFDRTDSLLLAVAAPYKKFDRTSKLDSAGTIASLGTLSLLISISCMFNGKTLRGITSFSL
jgi:hypothetical protein